MKKRTHNLFQKIAKPMLLMIFVFCFTLMFQRTSVSAQEVVNVYRLYLPSTGEHLYTPSTNEVNVLSSRHGWINEGTAWYAPTSGSNVYRLFNPSLGNHLYTTDTNEINHLTQNGWVLDNNGAALFYSGGDIPVYRLYNAGNTQHLLTIDVNEYNNLPASGWSQEGVKLYATSLTEPTTTPTPSTESTAPKVEKIYKYCPTSIDGNVLYCSNMDKEGEVKDGIFLNEGTKVLSTTANAWDSAQVCDPSVIKGSFTYKKTNYKYLMAYLGCVTHDNTNNEIGFAVSNDLKSWVKVGKVVTYHNAGLWGAGQPSLLVKNNNVFLFYTENIKNAANNRETVEYCRQLLSNDLTSVKLSSEVLVKKLQNCGFSDFISNADFAVSGNTLYMVGDGHVNWDFPQGVLHCVSTSVKVYSCTWDGTLSNLTKLNWKQVAEISESATGHYRNHNACFIRDGYGNLKERSIYVSTGDEISTDWVTCLWTYRFQKVNF